MLKNNINDLNNVEIDTDAASSETTKPADDALVGIDATKVEENILDNFEDLAKLETDLSSEKINELNKKLPSWSIVPPKNFVK